MDTVAVAIIGAGIAGLATAAALERDGVRCAVYEQSPTLTELGAGIQISPNGARLLHRLNLKSTLDTIAIRPEAIELYRWHGDAVARTRLGDECVEAYGAPYYVLRRADLHRALRAGVSSPVHLGRHCVSVEQESERVLLGFADGSRVAAELVIGADGIHSAVRRAVHGGEPVATHLNVYRGLVPAARMPERYREPTVQLWLGPGQHCVSYPVPGWISFVASVPNDERPFSGPGRMRDLLAAYTGWHPRVRDLLAAATLVSRWSLREGPALPRWTRGRVSLVGDAAHAMVPVGAQGASQAIEDAAALAACLDGAASPCALARYEAIRRPRLAQVAASAHGHVRDHHLPDGEAQRGRDSSLAQRHSLRAQHWLYGYDAELAVRS